MRYVNSKEIQAFVDRVEKRKSYRREYNLIFRHLLEEMGELSAAIWALQRVGLSRRSKASSERKMQIGGELVDIISLCVYVSSVLKVDLNEAFPWKFSRVARQYGVEFKESK